MDKVRVVLDVTALENLQVRVEYERKEVIFVLDPKALPVEDASLVRHSVYGARDVLVRRMRECFEKG